MNMHDRNIGGAALLAGIILLCGGTAAAAVSADDAGAKNPAPTQWRTLFDGKLLGTFRGWRSDGMPKGWHVVNGTLAKEGDVDDLVTREQFGNFELELEWKIGKAGNSGIFYRGTREYDEIYWSGPEYQLLDDANAPDGRNRLTAAASAYGLYAAPVGVVKPFGEWNTSRVVIRGDRVEHWLNGRKVVEYELNSPEWQAKVAASKFSQYPHYGLAKSGLIGIQGDHPGSLALRHIRIRELP
jgi:3-keto-disaccharide hydrolase